MTPVPANILILAREKESARRWREALVPLPGCRWLSRDEVPDGATPDLVITDHEGLPSLPAVGGVQGEGAVVRIGDAAAGDVWLPADVSTRELLLTCQLLAQVVHLRRKVAARTEAERRLALAAMSDPLTGMPNRRAWDQVLQERLAACGSSSGRLCVAVIDLDHFKRVNDAHGHPAGDQVLRLVGGSLQRSLRADDFVARLGGDEFGLILTVRDEANAAAAVDRVRGRLPRELAAVGSPAVTGSAGYCLAPAVGPVCAASPESLYVSADAALRKAKNEGRDRTVGH